MAVIATRRALTIGALLVGAVIAVLGVEGATSSPPAPLQLGSPIGAVFHRPLELVGACAEARIDHGHDVDPSGLVDQENDECFPAQHAKRAPDGRVVVG